MMDSQDPYCFPIVFIKTNFAGDEGIMYVDIQVQRTY